MGSSSYPPPYDHLGGPCAVRASRWWYGDGPDRWADLRIPVGEGPFPVAVLIHGGFWRRPWGADLMHALVADLHGRGWATWNVEYRRVGSPANPWPATFLDVAAAIDALAGIASSKRLQLENVVAIGHSAGGQLALWLASRPKLPAHAPGAHPVVVPSAVVALAAVSDLLAAARCGLGRGAAADLLGGLPDTVGERYLLASRRQRLPLGVPQLLVHGVRDEAVPAWMSEEYAAAATSAGDHVQLVRVPAGGHAELIDPVSPGWCSVAAWLRDLATGSPAGAGDTAERAALV